MSIKVMSMVFDRYPVGGAERLLALAIADHAWDDGTHIFPAIDTLAHKTMQSRSTVQRQIAKMLASGWLERAGTRTGRGHTNEYRIAPGWIGGEALASQAAPQPAAQTEKTYPQAGQVDTLYAEKKGVIQKEKGVTTDTKGVTTDVKGVTAMTPESSEPSMNLNTPLPPGGGTTGFDELFSIYPNHDNRAKAERRFHRLAPTAALQQTMRVAIEAQRLSRKWTKDDGEFVPEFANWLRNERWRDSFHGQATTPTANATAGDWLETRQGIDGKARELGLPAWNEAAFSVGQGESYPVFTARVKRAAAAQKEAVCA